MKFKFVPVVLGLMFAVSAVPDTARAGCPKGIRVKKATCKSGGRIKLVVWCSHTVERVTISLNGCAITEKFIHGGHRYKFGVNGLEPGEYTITVENPDGNERWEKVITCE